MEFTRCFRCMKEATHYPCPHCNFDPQTTPAREFVLRPGTILNGKYVVGTPLGQGGFGITYIGWDLVLESKVAIKEYFPSGQVGRSATGTLQWYSTPQAEAARNSGKEMFLKEARKMSRLREIPQVVHIRDLFQQNDTAYIVMDFVEGQTLMARLKKTGPLTWEQAQAIFFPAIRAMEQVHEAGLIHRDLSPDNLMLLPSGRVKILDLGAAKDLRINSGASSMQVAKGGFSPLEQYTQRGGSGTWSDVYAMAATMYYSLTGVLPPPVMDRMEDDQIRWDLEPLKTLPKPALEALKKAMVLLAKDRTQTMGEFLTQLEKASAKQKPAPKQKAKKKKSPLPAIAAVLVVALLAGWALLPKQEAEPQLESHPQAETQTEAPPETVPETTVPTEPESVFPLSIKKPENTFPLGIQAQIVDADGYRIVAVKQDGTVVATNYDNISVVSEWTDIVSVAACADQVYGLKADGTVVSANSKYEKEISSWTDIVAISVTGSRKDSYYYTQIMGLKADGTVVIAGKDYTGTPIVSGWKDIIAIRNGGSYVNGLKADGTVVALGYSNTSYSINCSDWTDIVDIAGGRFCLLGLRADGTVVATGYLGQCDVSDWTDIVAISGGTDLTVGLRADGTVVATGNNDYGQCDVSDWTDIVAVYFCGFATIGLRADGTMVATGSNSSGQCDVSGWTDIRIPDGIG